MNAAIDMKMPPVHPAAEEFPLIEGEDFDALVESIRKNGQIEPCWMWQGTLLDGRNRWRACVVCGLQPKTQEFKGDETGAIDLVVALNIKRRHLNATQKTLLADALIKHYEKAAKEAQVAAAAATNKKLDRVTVSPNTVTQKVEQAYTAVQENRNARTAVAQAAKATGTNRQYLSDLQKIKKADDVYELTRNGKLNIPEAKRIAAMSEPERKEAVQIIQSGAVKDGKSAIAQIKLEKKHALAAELNAKPLPITTGTFNVIAIDPPWQYEKRAEDITHRGRNPYPDMDIEAIKALPVGDRAEENCILWLWTTNAFMREAYECCDAWGFKVKTILTWAKDRMGTGDWLRGKTEHCIMAVRGKPLVVLTNQTTLLEAPLREHSRKPDEFYAMVEKLCPGTKLEFFARQVRNGWQAWGAETEKFNA